MTKVSQKEIDDFVVSLAETHPEYPVATFKTEFKEAISRNPTLPEINNFLRIVKNGGSSSSSHYSETVAEAQQLKLRCTNPSNTGKGVSWVEDLPVLLNMLTSAHGIILSSTNPASAEHKNAQEVVGIMLDLLTLLGYSFRIEHTGALQKLVSSADGFNKLLAFFWAASTTEWKADAAKILAFFFHNIPLPPDTHVIVPVLVQSLGVCLTKVTANPAAFSSYRRLLEALKCLCYTKSSATLLIDGDILPSAVGLLSHPAYTVANVAADMLGQLCLFAVSSPQHVLKIVNAHIFTATVKAISLIWSKNLSLLNTVTLVQAVLRGGDAAVDSAVGTNIVGQYLIILREYANGRPHGIEDPDIICYLVRSLLKISYSGLVRATGANGPNIYKNIFQKSNGLSILLSIWEQKTQGLTEVKKTVPMCLGCLLKGERPAPAQMFGSLLEALKGLKSADFQKEGYSCERVWAGMEGADTVLENWKKKK